MWQLIKETAKKMEPVNMPLTIGNNALINLVDSGSACSTYSPSHLGCEVF